MPNPMFSARMPQELLDRLGRAADVKNALHPDEPVQSREDVARSVLLRFLPVFEEELEAAKQRVARGV